MVPSPRTKSSFSPVQIGICLAGVLLLGAWLRFSGLNWDERQHLHPDERFLTMVVTAERWPGSVSEYLSEARSPLNPRNVGYGYFAYGTLPTTLVKAASLAAGRAGYDEVPLVGRAISASLDLGTLVLLFFLARRLYGSSRIALLAAFLQAVAVLPIQHAHFFVVDPFAVFFITAALLSAASVRRGAVWPYVAAGTCFGLALACKASVLPFAAVVVAVAVVAEGIQNWRPLLARLVLCGLTTVLVFRIAEPSAFSSSGLGFALSMRWLRDLLYTRQLMSGAVDIPPGVQWANRIPFVFQIENLVRWNLGPALGVTGCLAAMAATWQLVLRREKTHLIPVLWIALVFVPHIAQFVKAGRYLLPIYPMLTLLTAWGLVRLWDRARSLPAGAHAGRVAVGVAAGIVCVSTLLWAIAFTSIYRRPNTRVAASRWIYEHIPAGSVITAEIWDDRLPLRLEGTVPERYAPIDMPNYEDDSPAKAAALVNKIDGADFIVLSSNRLYDSIPRLPMRYPVTTRYYEALFDGRLGFDRVAEFTSYPRLGPLVFPDQGAEEAFSVYDHARVQIFKKTTRWNLAATEQLLMQDIDWNAVVPVSAANAGLFNNGQLLPAADWDAVRARTTWSRPVSEHSVGARLPIPVWCLAIELLGLLVFPLTSAVFRNLPDRGWLLSKTVGLLVVSYLAWLGASLRWWTFERPILIAICAVLAVLGAWWLWRKRSQERFDWQLLLGEEALFWTAFAAFLVVRAGNPDLWHPVFGGEKPMDFAYLNAVVRSGSFPPYDPWFAGGYINYYYFGFVLVAAPIALTGITPEVAYNLAIPTWFALTAGGAFSVAYALVHALVRRERVRLWAAAGGIFAVLTVTVLGNLGELPIAMRALASGNRSSWPLSVWYWDATRIVPYAPGEAPPITEFPFFTFLYGDLHAHLMALPLTLLALALAVSFVFPDRDGGRLLARTLSLTLLALTLGALYATNTWDYPTYLFLAGVALVIREWHGQRSVAAVCVKLAGIFLLSRLFFAPFLMHYSQAYGSVEPWTGSRTTPAAYLSIHGFFLYSLITMWVYWWFVVRRRDEQWPAAPLSLLGVLSLAGLVLSLAVEFVVLSQDISRMNTIFKVYLQVWVLWGIGAAVSIALLAAEWQGFVGAGRHAGLRVAGIGWIAGTTALALACGLYPIFSTRARWRDRFDPSVGFTLDGQAYLRSARHVEKDTPFALEPDLDAMRWLEREVRGKPVIAEAHTAEYRWGGRISSNTGLPTILGWSWHQTQQRAALPAVVVQRRAADVDALYSEVDVARAFSILDRYRVDYVYVGDLERITYPATGIAKFASHPDRWQPVYQNPRVTIYRVVR